MTSKTLLLTLMKGDKVVYTFQNNAYFLLLIFVWNGNNSISHKLFI